MDKADDLREMALKEVRYFARSVAAFYRDGLKKEAKHYFERLKGAAQVFDKLFEHSVPSGYSIIMYKILVEEERLSSKEIIELIEM